MQSASKQTTTQPDGISEQRCSGAPPPAHATIRRQSWDTASHLLASRDAVRTGGRKRLLLTTSAAAARLLAMGSTHRGPAPHRGVRSSGDAPAPAARLLGALLHARRPARRPQMEELDPAGWGSSTTPARRTTRSPARGARRLFSTQLVSGS